MKIRRLNEVYNDPYDDYDVDSDSYNNDPLRYDDDYEMSDFSDAVKTGIEFDAEGEEYVWFKPLSEIYHMDFDNWQLWSAIHRLYDTYGTNDEHDELAYFVVDIDTGFIDWGPCDTEAEAKEFLESKYDDYLNDEDDESPYGYQPDDIVDSLDQDDINYVGYYS